MSATSVATLQTIWDCRWSRPGYRLIGVEDHLQPEKLWVCVRTGDRRGKAFPDATSFRSDVMSLETVTRVETFLARLVMLVMAASIAYLGYSVITRPLAIPLAIVLWLGAAAMFLLGVWGKLPPATDPHDGRIRP